MFAHRWIGAMVQQQQDHLKTADRPVKRTFKMPWHVMNQFRIVSQHLFDQIKIPLVDGGVKVNFGSKLQWASSGGRCVFRSVETALHFPVVIPHLHLVRHRVSSIAATWISAPLDQ